MLAVLSAMMEINWIFFCAAVERDLSNKKKRRFCLLENNKIFLSALSGFVAREQKDEKSLPTSTPNLTRI